MEKQAFTLRILAINFLFLALPLLVDTFIFFQDFYYSTVNEARDELKEIASLRAYAMSELQPGREVLLDEIIHFLDLSGKQDLERWTKELTNLADKNPLHEFYIFSPIPDKNHQYEVIVASRPEDIGKSFISFKQFERLLADGKGVFLRYDYSDFLNKEVLYLLVGRTFYSPETKKALGIIVEMKDISQAVLPILSNTRFSSLQFALLDAEMIVFAASDPSFEGNYFRDITPERRSEIIKTT
ncbi:MAG: hypothetical protein ACKVOH_06460, partial [Chlamydiales bacterium]